MQEIIKCRAGISEDCLDGHLFYEDEELLSDDATWDGDTIICDACHLAAMPFSSSGAMLNHEFNDAIRIYRENLEFAMNHPHPAELVKLSQETADLALEGTPRHRSALACKEIALREIERRKISGRK